MRFRLFKIKPKSSLLLYHASTIQKNKGEETRNQKMRNRPFKIKPKSNPGAPKTRPKPSQIEPKRALGRLLDPLGPSWQQSLKKRTSKGPQETSRKLQTPLKTSPKSLPNPPKIDRKMQWKKTWFWEPFFQDFSGFLAQNPSVFHMIFNTFLTPNSNQNPCLFQSSFGVFFPGARKMQFCKN